MKVCKRCKADRSESAFRWNTVKGKRYQRHICVPCERLQGREYTASLSSRGSDEIPVVVEKICCSCHVLKLGHEFYPTKCEKDGLDAECKTCRKARNASPKTRNSKRLWKADAYHKNLTRGRTHGRYSSVVKRDRQKGLETCSWEVFQKVSAEPCVYCDWLPPHGNSVDRLDVTLGHVANNIAPCCVPCQYARSRVWPTEMMVRFIGPAIRAARQEMLARGVSPEALEDAHNWSVHPSQLAFDLS